jgi:hypothetical protein
MFSEIDDATARLLDSARRLTDEPPYASREAREADIAAGAGRSAFVALDLPEPLRIQRAERLSA